MRYINKQVELVMADYHKYVFRDGKLVAEFEQMYQRSQDIPWHQDEQENWIDVRLTAELMGDVGPFDEIHDYGCGLGYYLDILKKRFGADGCRTFGYDISSTACIIASTLFPVSKFAVVDLMAEQFCSYPAIHPSGKRLFSIRGTLWYVFPELENVVANLHSRMRPAELLLVVQNFPPLEAGFVGKAVIPDHHAIIQNFSAKFDVARTLWYEDRMRTVNDNWFIGIFIAR